jgi:hypothetical protein
MHPTAGTLLVKFIHGVAAAGDAERYAASESFTVLHLQSEMYYCHRA